MLNKKEYGKLIDLWFGVAFLAVSSIGVYCFYNYEKCGSLSCEIPQVQKK